MEQNEQNKNAKGGTELLMERLHQEFPDIHEEFQIIPSRVRSLDPNRKRIYYVHDLPQDPEVQFLKNGGWKSFKKIVFVSHWQQQMYNIFLGVPYEAGVVIPNSVRLGKLRRSRDDDKINLVYFSTPHRGLDILYESFKELQKDFGNDIALNVYSSFDLYGWKERDEPFEDLFKKLQDTEGVTYSKSIPNDKMRDKLEDNDVFAYPSTWLETSCLCLIESMITNLRCVHPNLGALPETSKSFTHMYQFTEDKAEHTKIFTNVMRSVIKDEMRTSTADWIMDSTRVAECFYDWDKVSNKWHDLFQELRS